MGRCTLVTSVLAADRERWSHAALKRFLRVTLDSFLANHGNAGADVHASRGFISALSDCCDNASKCRRTVLAWERT